MSKGSKSKAMLISQRSLCLKSIYKKVTSLTIRQTLKVVFKLKMNSTTPYSKVVTTCMMSSFLYFTRICLCLNYELYDSHSNKVQVSISEGDLSHGDIAGLCFTQDYLRKWPAGLKVSISLGSIS